MTVQEQMQTAEQFAELRKALMPDFAVPDRQQFLLWTGTYNEDLVSRGINRAACKRRKMRDTGTPMTVDEAIKYASSVMRNETLGRRVFVRGAS